MNINTDRFWKRHDEISDIGKNPEEGTGISRFAWTPEYKEAMVLLISWMQQAGMKVWIDTVGNLYGRLEGTDPEAPAVLTGSHLDTVPCGGKYDGILGITTALEALQTIVDKKIAHKRPIEMIAFVNEEASQFLGGHFGSKAMCGMHDADHAKKTFHRYTGQSLRDAMIEFGMGLNPDNYAGSIINPEKYYAFLELHIEQGQYLLKKNLPMSVVTSVAGIKQFYITFHGISCHSGGMAMADRHDAMAAAAATACEVIRLANESGSPTRGTVGYIEAYPAEHNIVANKAIVPVDFREDKDEIWAQLYTDLIRFVEKQCERFKVTYDVRITIDTAPAHCNPKIIGMIDDIATECGVPHDQMISYPAHDAMQLATLMPFGMIFVRSSNEGRSHCPEELTTKEDAAVSAEVLFKSIVRLANEDIL